MLCTLALLLGACGGGASDEPTQEAADGAGSETAAAGGGSLEDICAQGAEEGSFTYWATFEPDNWNRIYEPFAEAYPGIEVDFLPLRPQDAVQRILTSESAGQEVEVDMINGNLDALLPLVDRELVDADVDWTALDVPEDLIHPTGTVRIYRVPQGLAYNPDVTPEDELPSTWEELVDERWQGDLVVDPRGTPFNNFALEMGAEDTVAYVEELAEVVQPIVIEGGTAGMQAVAGGEAALAAGGRADSNAELQEQGVPVDVRYLDIVPTTDFYHLVLNGAPNRNAALCFAGWLASPEGQEVHETVEYKANETLPPDVPEDATIVSIETQEDAELTADVAEEISAIWTQGG